MSFAEKFKFSLRKLAISLKRNYYIVPLIAVFLAVFVIMCSLSTVSTIIWRAASSTTNSANGVYASLYEFIVCLVAILGCVAYISYAFVSYGKKRPLYMMIVFLVFFAIATTLLFMIYNGIKPSIDEDIAIYNKAVAEGDQTNIAAYASYASNGAATLTSLIWQIALCILSMVLVITAPFIQSKLKQIKFASISSINSTTSDAVEVEEEVK